MASFNRIRIPDYYYKGIACLISLDDAGYSLLEDALSKAVPSLYRGDLVSYVAEQVTIDKDDLEEIVQFLLSLYRVRSIREADVSELITDVQQSLQAEQKLDFAPKDGNWSVLTKRLDYLLRLDQSLGITAKAFDVMSQHDHLFVGLGTRIMTDIRPVFLDDLSQPPTAAVIVHTLKIVYHSGEDHKEFFVALDTDDVNELRNLLDRADQKASALQEILKRTPMQYLDAEVH